MASVTPLLQADAEASKFKFDMRKGRTSVKLGELPTYQTEFPPLFVKPSLRGIVPNRALNMARIACENLLKIISLKEVVARIDPVIVVEELGPVLNHLISQIVETLAMEEMPELWERLPTLVKNELMAKVREDSPAAVEGMLSEVKDNIETMIDLREIVGNALVRDPALLCHMFIATGTKELEFIRDFGATMGFVFGIIQVIIWIFYSAGWMLPAFGFVVGMCTNWIALKMIFEPVEPYPILGGRIVLQGLFLKRQTEAGAAFSQIVADNVLSSRSLIRGILTSSSSDKIFEMVHKHIRTFLDSYNHLPRPIISVLKGTDKLERCKQSTGEYVIRNLSATMRHAEKYLDSAMDLESVLSKKIVAMPCADFEQMLHPVFQEDEWKLVLLGGVLGVFVGCCQWWALGS